MAKVVVRHDLPVHAEFVGTLDGSVNADIRPKVTGYVTSAAFGLARKMFRLSSASAKPPTSLAQLWRKTQRESPLYAMNSNTGC